MTTPTTVWTGTREGRLFRPADALDRAGWAGLVIVSALFALALGHWLGWLGADWSRVVTDPWQRPGPGHWLGSNRLGQDILARAVAGTGTAFSVGIPVALASTGLGALLGGIAGWRAGRWLDEVVLWLTGVLDAIPFFLFVAAVAYALQGHPWSMQAAMVATFWTTSARLVRAEVMRLRHQAFVDAARVVGLGEWRILARHVVPNTAPILLVQAVIAFVAAIKSEVILSFLGIGVKGGVSWGLMLAESAGEVPAGHFGNFIVASTFLFALLLGLNLLADALQERGDPRAPVRPGGGGA